MIGQCLQQLVFTTHNILEMSKIRERQFKENKNEVKVSEQLDQIFDFFREDIRFRETELDVKMQPILE